MLSSSNILSFGMPFFDIPTIGNKKWDGSRWVSKDSPSYSDGTYRFDAFGEGGIDSPGLSDGFGDAAGLAGTSSLAGDRAADAMVGSFGQAAIGAGAKAGLGMAFGMSPTDALSMGAQSLANPGTIGGIVGAGINAGLGLSSLGPAQAALAGLAGLAGGPLAAAAVAAFGGFITNAIADFADVRDFENVKDLAEDTYGHGIKGLSVGETLANVAKGYSDMAPEAADLAFGQTLADQGLATSVPGVRGAFSALENDIYGELASTMSISPEAQAARDSFGVLGGLASKGMGVVSDTPATPAGTTTQGGPKGAPTAQAPDAPSAIGAPSTPGTTGTTPSAAPNAEAAATKSGDSDADPAANDGGNAEGKEGDSPNGNDSDGDSDHGAAVAGVDGPGEA